MEPKSIAIIGASADRAKFGNKAVRAYGSEGYKVFPVNPKEKEIEGLTVYKSVLDIPEPVETASFYVPPVVGLQVIEEVAQKGIREVYLNPGAESDELYAKAESLGIRPIAACSIRAIGIDPSDDKMEFISTADQGKVIP
ncbi:MAG: CoA-binding protein [Armatimonadetes bacterium]|nr:CoA-binding protein [Armatimonadota bacterium]